MFDKRKWISAAHCINGVARCSYWQRGQYSSYGMITIALVTWPVLRSLACVIICNVCETSCFFPFFISVKWATCMACSGLSLGSIQIGACGVKCPDALSMYLKLEFDYCSKFLIQISYRTFEAPVVFLGVCGGVDRTGWHPFRGRWHPQGVNKICT